MRRRRWHMRRHLRRGGATAAVVMSTRRMLQRRSRETFSHKWRSSRSSSSAPYYWATGVPPITWSSFSADFSLLSFFLTLFIQTNIKKSSCKVVLCSVSYNAVLCNVSYDMVFMFLEDRKSALGEDPLYLLEVVSYAQRNNHMGFDKCQLESWGGRCAAKLARLNLGLLTLIPMPLLMLQWFQAKISVSMLWKNLHKFSTAKLSICLKT